MSPALRVYQLLLRVYPAEFRAEFGGEMLLLFRERRFRDGARGPRFWAAIFWDVARSAPALRLEAWRVRLGNITHTVEGRAMRMTMAILAIVVGAIEAVNASQEVWLGGAMNRGWPLIGGTIAVVAGALLLTAGIALVRRSPVSDTLAQGAAITCLLVFILTGVVIPQMSTFATLLGIGYPVVMLLLLGSGRGRGSSVPEVA